MSEMRPVTDKEVRDAAERLRQTKAADDATDAAGVEAGYELGVRWACEIADYDELPRRNLDAGLARGRLSRSGTVRISSYFRTL
jgi:hypothetical protein